MIVCSWIYELVTFYHYVCSIGETFPLDSLVNSEAFASEFIENYEDIYHLLVTGNDLWIMNKCHVCQEMVNIFNKIVIMYLVHYH